MPLTISLNGADNVGKTTQVELLPRSFDVYLAGSLHESDNWLGQMAKFGTLKDWWWSCSDEDFVCRIFGALGRRYLNSLDKEQATVAIYDRGTTMFEAVAISVIAVKSDGRDFSNARNKFNEIIERNGLRVPEEQLKILLKHGGSLDESLNLSLSRETEETDERYRLYQTLLQSELQRQENEGLYHHIITAGASHTLRDVQDQIRQIIGRRTSHPLFTPMMHNINRIYAFGGLSESGKSSLAQSLCTHYGSCQAFRSKIVYFADQASEKLGKSIYTCSEKEQALSLLHELERFSNCHYWLKVLTIESLHRYTATKWLKTWLGDKLQIIYVDTAEEKRLRRSLVSPDSLKVNDTAKFERGADRIRDYADLVLDNNGTFAETLQSMVGFVNKCGPGLDL